MRKLLALLRGFPGHPSHPPFTDATIGAYTAGTAMAVIGWLGFAEPQMAVGAYLAVVVALVFSAGTVLTGFLDYVKIRRGTPLRRTANLHWLTMASASIVFVIAAFLLKDGYDSGDLSLWATLVTVLAWLLLLFGGWVGGTIVFVYGMRVQMQPGTPTSEALKPHLPPEFRRPERPAG